MHIVKKLVKINKRNNYFLVMSSKKLKISVILSLFGEVFILAKSVY